MVNSVNEDIALVNQIYLPQLFAFMRITLLYDLSMQMLPYKTHVSVTIIWILLLILPQFKDVTHLLFLYYVE